MQSISSTKDAISTVRNKLVNVSESGTSVKVIGKMNNSTNMSDFYWDNVLDESFTKGFIDDGDSFSLCVLPEEFRKQLAYCGKASGRNEDKVSESGLTVETLSSSTNQKVPYFAESRLVFVCKKLYAQEMKADCFTKYGKDIPNQMYADNDWHTTYVAEIEKILIK